MKLDLGIELQVQGQMQPAVKAWEQTHAFCQASPCAAQASHDSVARLHCDLDPNHSEEIERRQTVKRAALRPRRFRAPSTNGILSHPRGQFFYRCVLRDTSEMGAQIALPPGSPWQIECMSFISRLKQPTTRTSSGSTATRPGWPFGAPCRSVA